MPQESAPRNIRGRRAVAALAAAAALTGCSVGESKPELIHPDRLEYSVVDPGSTIAGTVKEFAHEDHDKDGVINKEDSDIRVFDQSEAVARHGNGGSVQRWEVIAVAERAETPAEAEVRTMLEEGQEVEVALGFYAYLDGEAANNNPEQGGEARYLEVEHPVLHNGQLFAVSRAQVGEGPDAKRVYNAANLSESSEFVGIYDAKQGALVNISEVTSSSFTLAQLAPNESFVTSSEHHFTVSGERTVEEIGKVIGYSGSTDVEK